MAPVASVAAARGGGGRGGARAMVVVTAPVAMATINDKLSAIGEGAATQSVTVMSPATGTLRELRVSPGQEVAANDVIGVLDADAQEIAAERARLAFTDAETALTRTNELARANNATSVSVAAAQLAYDNARLELQNAELELTRRTITTPIAGTVGLFQVSAGNAVTAQSIVTTIEDISSIKVSFWVPERYAPSITVGMPLQASAVALPGITIAGTVSAVDNRIDTASRTLKVEAKIPNEDGRLQARHELLGQPRLSGRGIPRRRSARHPVVERRQLSVEIRRRQGRAHPGRDHPAQFRRRAGEGRARRRRPGRDPGRPAAEPGRDRAAA